MTSHVPHGAVTVGYDGSENSHQALSWAVRLAEMERRPLCVVHAYEKRPWIYGPYGIIESRQEAEDAARSQGEGIAEKARQDAQELSPSLAVSVVVTSDDPREALAAAAPDSSVVVVGARGHSRMASLLLGSVSAWASRHLQTPVVVVRPDSSEEQAHQRIVVGTDASAVSAAALELAFTQASLRRLPLTVVHCFADTFEGGYGLTGLPDEDLEGLPDERLALAESVAGLREKYVDVTVDFELGRGSAARYLTLAANHASLVVVGSRQRSAAASVVSRSVSRHVVEHAACIVAVVPSDVPRET